MPEFSKNSLARLETCDPFLQMLCKKAINVMDFAVICGHRGEKEQNEAVKHGMSHVEWPDSKHNAEPSLAVDLAPWNGGIDWNDISGFYKLAGLMLGIAWSCGINLKWGGDFKNADGTIFGDYGHFELRR